MVDAAPTQAHNYWFRVCAGCGRHLELTSHQFADSFAVCCGHCHRSGTPMMVALGGRAELGRKWFEELPIKVSSGA